MRLFGYAMFGLGLGLLLLAGAALVLDLGALKPLYERVAGHYLEREVRVKGEMSVRLGRSVTASATDVTILGTGPDAAPLAQAEFVEVRLALPALFNKVIDIELARLEGKLNNKAFVERAPAEVVVAERQKQEQAAASIATLQRQRTQIEVLRST